jgi:anaerobic selenocysteine-containing dehydrogenase
MRSHDLNTTIYGLEDRYRGVHGTRQVVFVNPDDLAELGLADGQYVDIVSEFAGVERRAERFRLVSYPTARGCAAGYYPETNVLMSADDLAKDSNTPVAKGLTIRLEPAGLLSLPAPSGAQTGDGHPPGNVGMAIPPRVLVVSVSDPGRP